MKTELLFFEIPMQGVKFKEFKDRVLSGVQVWGVMFRITEFGCWTGPYRSK